VPHSPSVSADALVTVPAVFVTHYPETPIRCRKVVVARRPCNYWTSPPAMFSLRFFFCHWVAERLQSPAAHHRKTSACLSRLSLSGFAGWVVIVALPVAAFTVSVR